MNGLLVVVSLSCFVLVSALGVAAGGDARPAPKGIANAKKAAAAKQERDKKVLQAYERGQVKRTQSQRRR